LAHDQLAGQDHPLFGHRTTVNQREDHLGCHLADLVGWLAYYGHRRARDRRPGMIIKSKVSKACLRPPMNPIERSQAAI
jgi:hypothetical protein